MVLTQMSWLFKHPFFHKVTLTLEMIKVSHTLFALPFALLAFSLASAQVGFFSGWLLLKIVCCVLWARACAMTFNRLVDSDVDRLNPRTVSRPLAKGTLSRPFGVGFCLITAGLFVVTAGSINRLCGLLAVPTLMVLLGYSFTKRFTALSHFFLGFSLSLAPLGAAVAVSGQLPWPFLSLALAVLLWVAGFDVIYATQDEAFDRAHHLHSLVVRLGRSRALWMARLCHGGMLLALAFFGWKQPLLGKSYALTLGMVAFLLAYEHSLVKPQDPRLDLQKVNIAFFRINAVVSLLLLTAGLTDLL